MAFIWSSWLQSFSESKDNLELPAKIYYRAQKQLISELLASKTVRISVARSPVDPLVIRGYAVADSGELHWIYVKSICRRQGIATALLIAAGNPQTYTHDHEPGGSRLRAMGLVYDGRLFGGRDKDL